jgi:hypothetical protein
MSLSTATPEELPGIQDLRRLTQSIAMLDAIISPEWEYRYYSYNSKWGPEEQMASMRDGCGDNWFILFDRNGAALIGFAHEYPLAKDSSFAKRIQETVPAVYASFLTEPAFRMGAASFCMWRRTDDLAWNVVIPATGPVSPEEDGSAELIRIFDGQPLSYQIWAENYYERAISLPSVQAIYEHQPLTERLVANLNPELSLSQIMTEAVEIGYPLEPSG